MCSTRAAHQAGYDDAPSLAREAVVGTLGVIGPTRMAYDRVVPIVEVTAKLLSSELTQSGQTQP